MEKDEKSQAINDGFDKLKNGNKRFQRNLSINRNLKQEAHDTFARQRPFAAILSCLDSRVSAELVFDQGIGDVFNFRTAGNFVDGASGENNNILGSLEFAIGNGVKSILVLGHTRCGAIDAATESDDSSPCKDEDAPLACLVKRLKSNLTTDNKKKATEENVWKTIENIRNQSDSLLNSENNGDIQIRGGIYDLESRCVEIYDYIPPKKVAT